MKKLALIGTLSFAWLGNLIAVSANADPLEQAQHAHIASPKHYSLLLENDNVYVIKMTLKPGEQDNWHKHNAETVYFEKGGKAIISTSEKQMTLEIPDGHVMWHDNWEHQVKNIGDTTITAIIVESKR